MYASFKSAFSTDRFLRLFITFFFITSVDDISSVVISAARCSSRVRIYDRSVKQGLLLFQSRVITSHHGLTSPMKNIFVRCDQRTVFAIFPHNAFEKFRKEEILS